MIIPYTILALAINLLGRVMAAKLTLPIWCDSIGTFLIAYVGGPVCGGVVGFTNNIIYGIFVEQQVLYCILGALLGAVVGLLPAILILCVIIGVLTLFPSDTITEYFANTYLVKVLFDHNPLVAILGLFL